MVFNETNMKALLLISFVVLAAAGRELLNHLFASHLLIDFDQLFRTLKMLSLSSLADLTLLRQEFRIKWLSEQFWLSIGAAVQLSITDGCCQLLIASINELHQASQSWLAVIPWMPAVFSTLHKLSEFILLTIALHLPMTWHSFKLLLHLCSLLVSSQLF